MNAILQRTQRGSLTSQVIEKRPGLEQIKIIALVGEGGFFAPLAAVFLGGQPAVALHLPARRAALAQHGEDELIHRLVLVRGEGAEHLAVPGDEVDRILHLHTLQNRVRGVRHHPRHRPGDPLHSVDVMRHHVLDGTAAHRRIRIINIPVGRTVKRKVLARLHLHLNHRAKTPGTHRLPHPLQRRQRAIDKSHRRPHPFLHDNRAQFVDALQTETERFLDQQIDAARRQFDGRRHMKRRGRGDECGSHRRFFQSLLPVVETAHPVTRRHFRAADIRRLAKRKIAPARVLEAAQMTLSDGTNAENEKMRSDGHAAKNTPPTGHLFPA